MYRPAYKPFLGGEGRINAPTYMNVNERLKKTPDCTTKTPAASQWMVPAHLASPLLTYGWRSTVAPKRFEPPLVDEIWMSKILSVVFFY